MELRPFGKTGIQISAVGFGCWEIGGGYGSIEESEFIKAVNRALDLGINCFDTAEAYGFGASEKSLAKALGSRRKEAVITTKFGVGYPDAPNYRDSTRKRVVESIDKSLKALNTDYVDVYLIHWPDRATPFEEPMQALDELVKRGKVRAVGLSNFKLSEIEQCARTRRVDVVQYCWNMFDRRMQKEIFPYCRENGIGVMAYGSLAYGILTGTLSEESAFEKGDWRSRQGKLGNINLFQHLFGPDHFLNNLRAVEDLKPIAKRYNKIAAAVGPALDAHESCYQHCAGGMPQSARSRRQRRRARMVHLGRRYERDRRGLCASRRDHDAGDVARDGIVT